MAPCACTFKARVRHVVHSTDLSCRKVSFWVAPHREIVIDIKKKIKRRHADIWVICFFGLQDDLPTLNHILCTVSLRSDGCRAHSSLKPPGFSDTEAGQGGTATGTMLPASLFVSASSFPSRCHQGLCECHGPVLEQEPLLLVPRKGLSLDLSA